MDNVLDQFVIGPRLLVFHVYRFVRWNERFDDSRERVTVHEVDQDLADFLLLRQIVERLLHELDWDLVVPARGL